jgi:5-formyltetrahydrofolate cyclo-ligase
MKSISKCKTKGMNTMNKKEWRQQILRRLAAMDLLTYEQNSFEISQKLFQTDEWNHSSTIGVTISRRPEVDTWQIIRKGWQEGKRIVVPRCFPKERSMNFHVIESFTQLENVYLDLYEPKLLETEEVRKEEIDLLIVPGVAFHQSGYRIGFGGGYYDRYLQDYQGKTVSLAFSCQLIDHIPNEPHDIPVQQIITEHEFINCTKQ